MYTRLSIIVLAMCGHFMAMGVETTPQEYANNIFKALTVYDASQDIDDLYDSLGPVYDAIEVNDQLPTLLGQIKQDGKTLFERALEIDLACTKYALKNISFAITPIAQVILPPQNAAGLFEDAVRRLDKCGIQSDAIKNQVLAEFRKALFGITLFETLLEDIKSSNKVSNKYEKTLISLIDHATQHMHYLAYGDFLLDEDAYSVAMEIIPTELQSFATEFLSHQLATSLLDLKSQF